MILARFDGACDPNPGGHASCACLITENETELYRKSEYLGVGRGTSCNVAEYAGLMLILRWLAENRPTKPVKVIGDSMIVIRKMKNHSMRGSTGLCAQVSADCKLAMSFMRDLEISFEWEGRAANEECDAMCELEISEKIIENTRFI